MATNSWTGVGATTSSYGEANWTGTVSRSTDNVNNLIVTFQFDSCNYTKIDDDGHGDNGGTRYVIFVYDDNGTEKWVNVGSYPVAWHTSLSSVNAAYSSWNSGLSGDSATISNWTATSITGHFVINNRNAKTNNDSANSALAFTGEYFYNSNAAATAAAKALEDKTFDVGSAYYTLDVSFNANGGSINSANATRDINIIQKFTSIQTSINVYDVGPFGLYRTGYYVEAGAQWARNANGNNPVSELETTNTTAETHFHLNGFSSNKSLTLYANWKPNTYTINYYANGGSGTTAAQSATYGSSITLRSNGFTRPADYTANGATVYRYGNGGINLDPITVRDTYRYSFSCWTLGSTTGTQYNAGASYTVQSNANFYAKWTAARSAYGSATLGTASRSNATVSGFTVTFNANGGSCSTANATSTRTASYTFTGWNTAANGTGTAYNSGSYQFSSNTNLYAQWSTSYTNHSVNLPTATRTGYRFLGWSTSSSATSASYTSTYTPSQNITLYAVWEAYTLTIVYRKDGNGVGSNATQSAQGAATYGQFPITMVHKYDAVHSNGLYHPTTFGIDRYQSLVGYHYETGQEWYYTNSSGTKVTVSESALAGSTTQVIASQLLGVDISTSNKSVTLYINWLPNTYTIRYNSGDTSASGGKSPTQTGSTQTYTQTCTYGQNVTLRASNTYSLTGYIFKCWDTSSSFNGTEYQASTTYATTSVIPQSMWTNHGGEFNLYADWTPIQYTVVYNDNDEISPTRSKFPNNPSGSTANQTLTFDATGTTFRANGFSLRGYTFKGWSKTSGKNNPVNFEVGKSYNYVNLSSTQGAVVILYAVWEPIDVVVRFSNHASPSGAMPDPIIKTYKYDDKYGVLPVPNPTRYNDFLYWFVYTDIDLVDTITLSPEHYITSLTNITAYGMYGPRCIGYYADNPIYSIHVGDLRILSVNRGTVTIYDGGVILS